MKKMWHVYPNVIPDNMIDNIHKTASKYQTIKAVTGYDSHGNNENINIRNSEVCWIDSRNYENFYITSMIMQLTKQANRDFFGFDIDHVQDVQYTTYHGDEQNPGHYNWHADTFWEADTLYHRKLSFVLQLSNPDDYEGGAFKIDPVYGALQKDEFTGKGSVIIFPSFLRHMVEPITSGTRKSLVSWVEGPHFR